MRLLLSVSTVRLIFVLLPGRFPKPVLLKKPKQNMLVPMPDQAPSTVRNLFSTGLLPTALLIVLVSLFASCVSPQKLVYFPNQQDTSLALASLTAVPEPIIQENDILSITVSSLDPIASAVFNAPNLQVAAGGSSQLGTQTGYLVGATGYIEFPILGQVKASGLTKPQLSKQITQALLSKELLLNPIVSIRQLNYHITLIGEVGRPGVYNIPSEKVNLLEALGQGGDLTPYANRETVVLIREEGGQRIFRRINLNSSSILSSPYYYLKSNDVVYAESNKVRAQAVSNQGLLIGYGLTALGTLISVVTLIVTLTR
jgi:polysaccharide export outer membrane protein